MSSRRGYTVLIDGYNALKRQSEWRRLPLADARQRLLGAVNGARWPVPVTSVIVVFDGQERSCHQPTSRQPVCVQFAAGSADAQLQRAIRNAAEPSRLLVVSDDREILRTAKSHHAHYHSIDWLMDRCLRILIESPGPRHEPGTDKASLPAATARRITEELQRRWLDDPSR